MKYRGRALAVAAMAATTIGVACYGPTEVRLEISTDRPCKALPTADEPNPQPVKTSVAVGGSAADVAQVSETSSCIDTSTGAIGSLVIVPSAGHDARVAVQVVMTTNGRPTSDCVLDAKGNPPSFCIVARRSFSFIDHTSRTLPIRLYDACRGVGCGAEDTCGRGGGCRPADVPDEGDPADEPCIGPQCADGGVPPDAAADGAVDPTVDAGPPTCVGPNGDHIVSNAPGSVSEKLVASTNRLYWDVASSTGGVEVHSIAKNGGLLETLRNNEQPWPEIVALAADDENLWVASATSVTRIEFSQKLPVTIPIARVASIALQPTPNGTAAYFAVPALTAQTPGALWVSETPASAPRQLQGAFGGEHVAIAGGHAYVVDGVGSKIYRHQLPWPPENSLVPGVVTTVPGPPAHAVTSFGTGFYFLEASKATGEGLLRVVTDPPQDPHPLLATVAHPGRIAADGQFVYYLDHGATEMKVPRPGAVRRASSQPGPIIAVPTQEVIGGFEDVHGLALDSCVYFFTSTSSGLLAAKLVVYPKSPPAAPAPTP